MAKILVTGGAGYIGSIILARLLKLGHDAIAVDDLSKGHRENVPAGRLVVARLQDTERVASLLEGRELVLHFAAFIAVGESVREPERYFENNVGGSLSLLTAMDRAGVSKLVFSSTAAVYGEPKQVPIPEDHSFSPESPYGESKATVERILDSIGSARPSFRSVRLRYFNACGADPESGLGENHEPETHLIPLLFRAIRTGQPINLFGDDYPTADGTCIRDYIHVLDLADAHVAAVDHLLSGGASKQYNVGTGTGNSVFEVLRAVERVTGKKVPHTIAPRRPGDCAVLVADSSRLQRELGWQAKRSLDDMVAHAWAHFSRV